MLLKRDLCYNKLCNKRQKVYINGTELAGTTRFLSYSKVCYIRTRYIEGRPVIAIYMYSGQFQLLARTVPGSHHQSEG